MVVIAVENPAESVPTMAGTTAGGYGSPPGYLAYGSARAMMAALAKDYRLRELTAWPILPLHVHCAVLEITDGQRRDVLLSKLAHDRRVRLAEPLQSFRTLSTSLRYDTGYESLQRGLEEIDALAAQRVTHGDHERPDQQQHAEAQRTQRNIGRAVDDVIDIAFISCGIDAKITQGVRLP
jgi:hypothetical protein